MDCAEVYSTPLTLVHKQHFATCPFISFTCTSVKVVYLASNQIFKKDFHFPITRFKIASLNKDVGYFGSTLAQFVMIYALTDRLAIFNSTLMF